MWDNGAPEYDGATAGSYTFTGILTLVEGIANSDDLKAEVKVNVLEPDKEIILVSPLEDIEVAKGTEKAAIGLPSTVEVTLEDDSTMLLSVVWDNGAPEYDGATAGSYTFTGALTLVEGIANTDDLKAEVKVDVLEIITKWGDVNGDEVVNATDVLAYWAYIVRGTAFINSAVADVNGDEVVNATDVLAVWAKIVRETPFPVEQ